jgi:hypothetical protein
MDEAQFRADIDIVVKGDEKRRASAWVVPYTYTVFEEESAFIYLEIYSLKLIYIMNKHGYIHKGD